MNWESILTQVILSAVGIVFSTLGAYMTYWISKRIKDDKLRGIVESLNDLVKKATLETYQTYVEGLKDANIFDAKAQNTALQKAVKIVKENMPKDVSDWLKENRDDVEAYIRVLIEAQIASLKK